MGGVCVVERDRLVGRVAKPRGGFAVVYTGVSADTRVRVDQYRQWRADRPESAAVLRALHETSEAAIRALVTGAVADWNDAVREFAGLERQMTAGGVEVFTEPVERCVSSLEREGWAAKPSGAGGGDVVVAFHPSADPQELDRPLAASGFSRIPLALEPSGVLLSAP
jgi:mevalonate kinase